jgi:hypothetical protein
VLPVLSDPSVGTVPRNRPFRCGYKPKE